MHKIVVEKDEAVADLIERILEAEHENIRLVVPKKSHLLDSPNNFRLLAREAQALGKTIEIESVDPDVLTLAKENGLASTHPLFDEKTPEEGGIEKEPAAKGKKKSHPGAVPLKVQYEDSPEVPVDESAEEKEERYDTLADYTEKPKGRRMVFWGIIGLIGLGILIWGFDTAFGKAEVVIRFQKTPWNFEERVAALTSVRDIDPARDLIPGQLFQEEKSLVQSFPASGRANVNVKAKGIITIVNAYSSASQQLVATTRFETPDGKIFRLDNGVVVPGASVTDGKITPSSIKAPVTADVAGPSGNVGRIEKLTIPGFKGSPKYNGFYGVLENGTSGGATGERAVATDADVESARSKVNDILKAAFQAGFLGAIPSDIKILDGASALAPGNVSVDRTAGADGKFNLTANAIFQAFGFREGDIYGLLDSKMGTTSVPTKLQNTTLIYASVRPDFGKKELQFTLKANGELVPVFNSDEFRGEVAGLKREEARAKILALPQLEDAQIKLWPAWLRSLPGKTNHIQVVVE